MARTILVYVSQYKNKYFFNEEIGPLPENVKKELLTSLIFITEEAGGITEFGFEEDGEAYVENFAEEGDLGYDMVSGRLLISEFEHEQADLIHELEVWYAALQDDSDF